MNNLPEYQSRTVPFKSEFAPKYWIPGYGLVRAAINMGKRESILHDTPREMPTGKRALRTTGQLVWLAYQGITLLAAYVGVFKGLEKILK